MLREQAAQAEIDVALHQPHDAVELGGPHLNATMEARARAFREQGPRRFEPAVRRALVDAVEIADLLDVEPVDEVMAQHVAVANLERRDRLLERLLELGGVE